MFSAAAAGAQITPSPHTGSPFRLLYFTADWCGPCQLMQRETWPAPAVQTELKQYSLHQIDIDAQSELAEQWGVRSIPTFIVAAADSDEPLARATGFMDADRMRQWLRDARRSAAERLQRQAELRQVYASSSQRLAHLGHDPDDAQLDDALQALFTLLAFREDPLPEHRTVVEASLGHLAEHHPEKLVTGLLHEDLQVRVHVSRALSTDARPLDPWADLQARTRLVDEFLNPN
ncbi:MAG: thioredoxin family protein [Verrucomicrobiota bacterium]